MKTRVELGAVWLDEQYPDWVDKIDLDKLYMPLSDRCISTGSFVRSTVTAWTGNPVLSTSF